MINMPIYQNGEKLYNYLCLLRHESRNQGIKHTLMILEEQSDLGSALCGIPLSPARMKKIQSKNGHNIFPIISLWRFFQTLKGNDWIWTNFELIRDFMVVLVTCKNEEEHSKGARVARRLFVNFSEAQGQITP